MVNYFIGVSQAQLETWLALAQEDFANGKTVTEAQAGDASTRETVQVDVAERIQQLLYALSLLDPVTYPPAQCKRVTRTRLQIWGWVSDGVTR